MERNVLKKTTNQIREAFDGIDKVYMIITKLCERERIFKSRGIFEGLPNQKSPYCSENLKTIPCKKFCDEIFGVNNYIKAIGFRKEDMPRRITFAEAKIDKTRIFPLLTDFYVPIDNLELNRWWNKQPFKLGIHGKLGHCELCWKKSDKTLVDNIRYGTRS